MTRLLPPKLFTAQPSYAAGIDSMHPLGSKVTAAIAGHINGCRTEIITGLAGAIAGTAPVRNTKQKGLAADVTVQGGIYFPATKMWGDGTQPFSIDLLLEGNGSNSQFDRVFDFGGNTSSGGWDIEVQATTSRLNFTPWAGPTPSNISFGTTSLMAAGDVHYLTIVFDNNSTVHLYIDGVQVTSSGGQSISASAKANAFFACADTSGNNFGKFGLHFLRVFDGTIIPPSAVAELASNPWQLFSAPRTIVVGTTAVSANVNLTGIAASASAAALTTTSDANVSASRASAAGAAQNFSLFIDSNISLTAVSAAAADTALALNVGAVPAGVSASGQVSSFSQNNNVALSTASASAVANDIFASARIVSLSVIGAMRDKLAIDAIASNRPVATNGTMSSDPVVSIGTLLAA